MFKSWVAGIFSEVPEAHPNPRRPLTQPDLVMSWERVAEGKDRVEEGGATEFALCLETWSGQSSGDCHLDMFVWSFPHQ